MARHALVEHTHRTRMLKIREAIAYDGVENFARSQYEPNNINQAIGYDSQFIYDFNFAPLNRKGRMSERQKKRKAELEASEGPFPRDAIRHSSAVLFKRLAERCEHPEGLELLTDEHYLYRRALQFDLKGLKIRHRTISAKATRLYKHILFPVNHTDLLLRHHSKAFTRETISFSKNHGAMIHKYALLMVWKNYFRPQFIKRHVRRPETNVQTPAMTLGLTIKRESFSNFFGQLRLPTQTPLSPEWSEFYSGRHTYPRSPSK